MKHWPNSVVIVFLLAIGFAWSLPAFAAAPEAPYVDSKAIKDRFDQVTAQDMDLLRTKKILFASRSFGLCLCGGLNLLAKQDAKYQLMSSYQRFDVNKAGSDLSIIPADMFTKVNFLHVICTQWPLTKRVDEMDNLLRQPPHDFGKTADVVIIYYHLATPEMFDYYAAKMDALRADYPKIKFIYVTAAFMGPPHAKENEVSHAFSEMVRERYKGKVPLYDLGKILSDDFRAGHVYCPEYSKDPAGLHPDLPAGEIMMAKGFLLVLAEAFRQDQATATAAASSIPPIPVPSLTSTGQVETLPATDPDYKAVRAILDANGLKAKTVSSVSVVRNGRIAELFLQEGGISELTDDIGSLTALQKLHLYGDRNLQMPLLKKISPAIGKCTELQELLLNQNDLTTLPVEITNLQKLQFLSLADNHLKDLPPTVQVWAQKNDPKGLGLQNEVEAQGKP